MTYPGLPFGLMIAVAIGTAIYYYFRNENPPQAYNYGEYNWDIPSPGVDSNGEPRSRSRKRRNSNVEQDYCRDCCSICFEKLKISKTQRLSCDHVYHAKCISKWLCANRSCPLCRAAV